MVRVVNIVMCFCIYAAGATLVLLLVCVLIGDCSMVYSDLRRCPITSRLNICPNHKQGFAV